MDLAEIVAPLNVTVAYSAAARQLEVIELQVPVSSTVAFAITQSGVLTQHTCIDLATQKVGVWGHLCALDQVLRDLDRIEIYRPLLVDPKEARRQRYQRDKVKPNPEHQPKPSGTSSRRR